jgi:hypothetical protein
LRPRAVIILLILLNARQNLRQHKYAAILEKLTVRDEAVARNPYVWAFVVGCGLTTMMRPLLRRIPPPPPVLWQVPAFTLVDSRDQPFGSEQASRARVRREFLFLRVAPRFVRLLMKGVATLQRRFRDGTSSRSVS